MFVVHFLVPETDPSKPALETGTGPELPPELQKGLGQTHVGKGGRFVVACGLPTDPQKADKRKFGGTGYFDGEIHRATHLPDHGETCEACKATEVYKKNFERHPRHARDGHDVAVSKLPGCCD